MATLALTQPFVVYLTEASDCDVPFVEWEWPDSLLSHAREELDTLIEMSRQLYVLWGLSIRDLSFAWMCRFDRRSVMIRACLPGDRSQRYWAIRAMEIGEVDAYIREWAD